MTETLHVDPQLMRAAGNRLQTDEGAVGCARQDKKVCQRVFSALMANHLFRTIGPVGRNREFDRSVIIAELPP
jgi:hypothetical protein